MVDDAMINTKQDVRIATMMDVLRGAGLVDLDTFMPSETEMVPMYVVTNAKKTFGASAVLFAKEKLYRIFDSYIVLPSSVHEVIIVPGDVKSVRELIDLVNEVNETQVAPEERLGDTVYQF